MPCVSPYSNSNIWLLSFELLKFFGGGEGHIGRSTSLLLKILEGIEELKNQHDKTLLNIGDYVSSIIIS